MSPEPTKTANEPDTEPMNLAEPSAPRQIGYVMTLNIINDTPSDLKPVGTSFFKEDGDIQERPTLVPAHSSGSGGVLSKFAGNGLFGLVGYTTPDPNKNLVIMTWMPAERGTLNRCWVGLLSSGTTISSALAESCHAYTPTGFTEGKKSWEFTHKKESYLLIIEPSVGDPKGFNTYSTINMILYKKADASPV